MILPREGERSADPEAMPAEGVSAPEGSRDDYTVRLDHFEGPLHLLLYLIQRDEIDIYDIPIAHITSEYLALIEDIDKLDLENAGEFLVMASTLMRIKARLLLPVQTQDEEDEGEDPRDELVRRLLEYKKYKEASEALGQAEEKRRQYFQRALDYPFRDQIPEEPPEFSLSLYDLLRSVQGILDRLEGDHRHHVYQDVFTVEEQTGRIQEVLRERGSIRFEEVFAESRVKMEVVVTFVAMLELMKRGFLTARQVDNYGEIWLYLAQDEDEPASASQGPEADHAS